MSPAGSDAAAGLRIRPERATDVEVIADIVRRTYADVPYSDQREHRMVARLRGSAAFVPGLSLLAEVDGEPAGHVLLTRITIGEGARAGRSLALAPLSVAPGFRGRGVGGALVEEAHRRARDLGFASVVVVGIADFYPKYGYLPLDDFPITLPFKTPSTGRLVIPLFEGALAGVAGEVHYAPEWMAP